MLSKTRLTQILSIFSSAQKVTASRGVMYCRGLQNSSGDDEVVGGRVWQCRQGR